MSRLNSVYLFICRHKYIVVGIIIILIVGFLDDNSFVRRYDRWRRMSQLRSEIEVYKAQYEAADQCIREMDANPRSVEKIARERYYMKRPNEDIFVIRDEEKAVVAEAAPADSSKQ